MYQQYNNKQTTLTLPIELDLSRCRIVYIINASSTSIVQILPLWKTVG